MKVTSDTFIMHS